MIRAYREGALEAGASIKELALAGLKFNPNKQFNNRVTQLEPDLQESLEKIRWAGHIVVFCPVFASLIPTRVRGFFDRLFMPDQVFLVQQGNISNNFSGKSARIVSILDDQSWEDWQEHKKVTYHSIKKSVFESCRMTPVHTNTIGVLHSLDNDYSKKWQKKMRYFGQNLI